MTEAEKKALIKQMLAEGKIKELGNGNFTMPSSLFALGITGRLIGQVVKNERKEKL